MAGDGAEAAEREGAREAEEGANEDEEALLHFARYSEARLALPWEQRTLKERILYCVDRLFLVLVALFVLVLAVEMVYKVWYVTSWGRIYHSLSSFFTYLFRQEDDEELSEL